MVLTPSWLAVWCFDRQHWHIPYAMAEKKYPLGGMTVRSPNIIELYWQCKEAVVKLPIFLCWLIYQPSKLLVSCWKPGRESRIYLSSGQWLFANSRIYLEQNNSSHPPRKNSSHSNSPLCYDREEDSLDSSCLLYVYVYLNKWLEN